MANFLKAFVGCPNKLKTIKEGLDDWLPISRIEILFLPPAFAIVIC